MRVSYEWLTDFVDLTDVTPVQAGEALTAAGFTVESVELVDLSAIVIGRVVTQTPHPRSRNPLWIHEVDIGGRVLSIVAGAPNAVPGSVVPVALPGTVVPGGKPVESKVIAGVPAQGMLCSAAELQLGDDHSGILVLDEGVPGRPLTDVFPLDAVLEAEITSNRPDCLAHLGLARELAAMLGRPLRRDFMPLFTAGEEPPAGDLVKVFVEAPDLCSRYIGAPITGIQVRPSPRWMQRRLRAAGVRPISNVVDITNYVLLEYGQPLHAFDLVTLAGPEIRARRARTGEEMLGLDGEVRRLTPDMLVIADAERPVAIAGVMGGLDSAVTDATTGILLEAACFNGPAVRATSRALGLRTEASSRFEKGLPPELALAGARRAAGLYRELAGGQVHREWLDAYPAPQEPVRVRLWPVRVDSVLGVHVPLEDAEAILRRLEFHVRVGEDGAWDVLPPVYRGDVSIPEDLVEEIGRIFGYDRIPATLPGSRQETRAPVLEDATVDRSREVLAGAGFNETVSVALVAASRQRALGTAERMMVLANGLSDEADSLRTSLLPSLADVVRLNRSRDSLSAPVFEAARVYLARPGEPAAQPEEPLRLAALLPCGPTADSGRAAVLRMKSVLDRVAHVNSCPAPAHRPEPAPLFHPGRCAAVVIGGEEAGFVGELHPATLALLGLEGRAAAFEIDVAVLRRAAELRRAAALARYPAAARDLAVVVAAGVAAGTLLDTIRIAAGDLLEEVTAFDEYRGAPLPEGSKSVAFRLEFRSRERTLTDADVVARMERVQAALREAHGAGFRE